MTRRIDYIVIHCSATKEGHPFDAADIDRWHRARGWNGIGYHFVILLDGSVQIGRPVSEVGAHVAGFNKNSIGICYIGGLDEDWHPKDTRTDEQKKSLRELVRQLHGTFPDAKIVGHRDLSPDKNGDGIIDPSEWLKECPCFNVKSEFRY